MDIDFSDTTNATVALLYPIVENQLNAELEVYYKIQKFVIVTFFVFVLQLGFRLKRFAYGAFRYLAWMSFLLVPVLLSYILGLLGHKGPTDFRIVNEVRFATTYTASIWAVLLLFVYSGVDNLAAFSVHEGRGRSKLVIQFVMQFVLIVLLLTAEKVLLLPILFVFAVVCFKFMERLVSLGHACGATLRIKRDVTRVIEYANHKGADDDGAALDPTTMRGFNYLVGPRYSTVDADKTRIMTGITLEKVWGCSEDEDRQPWLLSPRGDRGGHLKDTCLSFSLFWLLLGKFRGYPLYKKGNGSRRKAWRLVRDGLLAKEGGGQERAFRVIEVELAFLRDYFHSKYIFFYLNGFYWKLSILAILVMLWWFFQKFYKFIDDHAPPTTGRLTSVLNQFSTVKSPLLVVAIATLEVLQLVVFLTSRWVKVTLLCYYVKVRSCETSTMRGCISYLLEIIGALYRGPSWVPKWKLGRLQQYSLVQSCSALPKGPRFLQLVSTFLGIPFPRCGEHVKLSDQVKEAVVASLRNMDGPKLSNKITSLGRSRMDKELSSPSINLNDFEKDVETILVWHVATCFCELHPHSQAHMKELQDDSNYKTATSLSKYCAYLLVFAPSLTSLPTLQAEAICDNAIEKARAFFYKKRSVCCKLPCTSGKNNEVGKYAMMDKIEPDEEEAGHGAEYNNNNSILHKGVILGKELTNKLGIDRGEGWETLAEVWAEMILFLAQPNGNEMDHAQKLAEGGEFITQLWALLIHAGIDDNRVGGLPTL